jgi:two-component system cell cycle response regulator
MPVMDGVEMLTKLKSDPQLKGIPVIMLTAEGGRDNVLKIAKIGVRDYIVKPFKEEVLIEKAVASSTSSRSPSVRQGQVHFRSRRHPRRRGQARHHPADPGRPEAHALEDPRREHPGRGIDFCTKTPPDLIMISLSLPRTPPSPFSASSAEREDEIHAGLRPRGEDRDRQQQQAQTVGFSAIITKPIEVGELESKIAKAMNLDTSQRYFTLDSDILIMRLPENCSPAVLAEVGNYLKPKFSEAVDAGITRW